jgi:hypothetical protein
VPFKTVVINPLSVAINKSGKKSLILDLSVLNKFVQSSKVFVIPNPSSKYKTILIECFLQNLTIDLKHLVNKQGLEAKPKTSTEKQ